MELDSFFNSQRWNILEIISSSPASPLELSRQLGTSVSYVSQQLKLLEAANLISKQKTGAAEKGKARTVFSISREMIYLTALIRGAPYRKLINLTEHHRLILRIWFIDNPFLHYTIEKLYWKLEEDIDDLAGIYVDSRGMKSKLYVVSDSKKLKQKVEPYLKQQAHFLDSHLISAEDFSKMRVEGLHKIYSNSSLMREAIK